MLSDQTPPSVLRLGGVTAVLAGPLFFASVQMLVTSGWYPEGDYGADAMAPWLAAVSAHRTLALSGIALTLAAIVLWLVVGFVLYGLLREARPATALGGLAGFVAGGTLALAAFGLGAGATWALTDAAVPPEPDLVLAVLRAFAAMDYAGSVLVGGLGVGLMSVAALRTGALPKWVSVTGLIAAVLVTLAAGRLVVPALGAAAVGYPLLMLWFVLVGVALLRASRSASAPPPAGRASASASPSPPYVP